MTSSREKFRNHLSKKRNKILTIDDIKSIGKEVLGPDYADAKIYKLIYHTKHHGSLIAVKKDLFVPTTPDANLDEQSIIDKHYRPLLKKEASKTLGRHRYIGGLKALELITSNYSPIDTIDIINPYKQGSSILLLDKKITYKTYTHKKESLYPTLARQTEKIKIGPTAIRRASLELALLESLYSPDIITLGYTEELIKRTLKKYKRKINPDHIIALVRINKHHSSLNRLHQLALGVDAKLATMLENIIRKYSFVVEV